MDIKKITRYISIVALLLAILTGCGEGNGKKATPSVEQSSEPSTTNRDSDIEQSLTEANVTKTKGYLIDSALSGVNYSCDSNEAITDDSGMFECQNPPIVFKIGNLILGELEKFEDGKKIYLQDLLGLSRSNFTDTTLKLLARFLQSLDDDGNIDKVIKIEPNISTAFDKEQNFKDLSESDIRALLGNVDKSLKSEDDAIKHLRGSMGMVDGDVSVVGGYSRSSSSIQKITINGTAQLGFIKGGTVSLYSIKNINIPLATTKTSASTDIPKAGSFSFKDVVVDDSQYYLVTINKGKDIDTNDDGQIDSNPIDLNGTVHALVSGKDLKSGFRVNALTDLIYITLKSGLGNLTSQQIKEKLDSFANEYLFDIDGDGVISYKDILLFNPINDRSKYRKNYKTMLENYIPLLHNNIENKGLLKSSLFLNKFEISIENGNMQEVPFKFNAGIENLPTDLIIKWLLNNKEINIGDTISEDKIYEITAQIFKGDEYLRSISTELIGYEKSKIATINIDVTGTKNTYIYNEDSEFLSGTEVVVPNGALSQNTTITVNETSVEAIPNTEGSQITKVLVMEPSGLTFDKPILIKLPYMNEPDEHTVIARYSNGVVDYIKPLYIDRENKHIVFETDHFSTFAGETGFFSDTTDEKLVDKLNDNLGFNYDIDKWKSILNQNIYEGTDINIYDIADDYVKNVDISDFINADDSTHGGYTAALERLFPNSRELDKRRELWDKTKKAWDYVYGGKKYTNAFLARARLGTLLSLWKINPVSYIKKYTLYNPMKIGDKVLKKLVDLDNNDKIKKYYETGLYNEGNEYLLIQEEGVKRIIDIMIRRYNGFKENRQDIEENLKEMILQASKISDKKSVKLILSGSDTVYKGQESWLTLNIYPHGYGLDYLSGEPKISVYKNNKLIKEFTKDDLKKEYENIIEEKGKYYQLFAKTLEDSVTSFTNYTIKYTDKYKIEAGQGFSVSVIEPTKVNIQDIGFIHNDYSGQISPIFNGIDSSFVNYTFEVKKGNSSKKFKKGDSFRLPDGIETFDIIIKPVSYTKYTFNEKSFTIEWKEIWDGIQDGKFEHISIDAKKRVENGYEPISSALEIGDSIFVSSNIPYSLSNEFEEFAFDIDGDGDGIFSRDSVNYEHTYTETGRYRPCIKYRHKETQNITKKICYKDTIVVLDSKGLTDIPLKTYDYKRAIKRSAVTKIYVLEDYTDEEKDFIDINISGDLNFGTASIIDKETFYIDINDNYKKIPQPVKYIHYHSNNISGTDKFTYTITNKSGQTSTGNIEIRVGEEIEEEGNKKPIAKIVSNTNLSTIYIGDTVSFTAKDSYDKDGTIKSYLWEIEEKSGTNRNYNYSTLSKGVHVIKLTVKDNSDESSETVTKQFVVKNHENELSPTVIKLGSNIFMEEQTTKIIPFTISDNDNRIDTIGCYTTPTGITISNTNKKVTITAPQYNLVQGFTLKCTAYDSDNKVLSNDEVEVSVTQELIDEPPMEEPDNQPPTVDLQDSGVIPAIDANGNPAQVYINSTVMDEDIDTITYHWDVVWNEKEGEYTASQTSVSLPLKLPQLEGGESGSVTITLTVTDKEGLSATDTATYSYSLEKIEAIEFISQNFTDGETLSKGVTKNLEWRVKNVSNVNLKNIILKTDGAFIKTYLWGLLIPSPLTISQIEPISIDIWKKGEIKTFKTTVTESYKLREATHIQQWNFYYDTDKALIYSNNGMSASIFFELKTTKPNDLIGRLITDKNLVTLNETVTSLLEITSGNAPYKIEIDWGDGQNETFDNIEENSGEGLTKSFNHSYTSTGSYHLNIKVIDNAHNKATFTDTINVLSKISTTAWTADVHNIETDEKSSNIMIKITEKESSGVAYGEYHTTWGATSNSTSNEYFVKYRLPIPPKLLMFDKKMRITVQGIPSKIVAHDREINFRTSDSMEYTASIRDTDFQETLADGTKIKGGYFASKNLSTGVVTKEKAEFLNTDNVNDNDLYAMGINPSTGELNVYKESSYTNLFPKAIPMHDNWLTELDITFKGNGTVKIILLEYDLDGNGEFSSDEKLVLNTVDKIVDWSKFINEEDEIPEEKQTYDENGNLLTYIYVYSNLYREGSYTYYDNETHKTHKYTDYYRDGSWKKYIYNYNENGQAVTYTWENSDGSYGNGSYTYYSDGTQKTYEQTYYYGTDSSWTKHIYNYDENGKVLTSTWEHNDGSYGNGSYTYYSNGIQKTYEIIGYYIDGSWAKDIYNYDENGKALTYTWENSNGSYGNGSYTYYSNGTQKTYEYIRYYTDDSWNKDTYNYDENGKLSTETWENSDGSYGNGSYTYYSNGIKKTYKSISYYADGTLRDKSTYIYDTNGDLIMTYPY